MTYNVFSGTLNPTHSLTPCTKAQRTLEVAADLPNKRIQKQKTKRGISAVQVNLFAIIKKTLNNTKSVVKT